MHGSPFLDDIAPRNASHKPAKEAKKDEWLAPSTQPSANIRQFQLRGGYGSVSWCKQDAKLWTA